MVKICFQGKVPKKKKKKERKKERKKEKMIQTKSLIFKMTKYSMDGLETDTIHTVKYIHIYRYTYMNKNK